MGEQTIATVGAAGSVVELHFTPEPGDYVRTMRAFFWRDRRTQVNTGLLAVVFLFGVFYLLGSGPPTLSTVWLVLLPLLVAVFLWFGLPLLAGLRVRREPRLRSPTTHCVSDARFEVREESGETSLEWTTFHRAMETKTHYLLVLALNRRTFFFVPRRAFVSGEQEAAFRDIVKRHLPGLLA